MKLRPAVLGEDDLKAFPFLRGAAAFDSSCSESARVFFIDKDGGYFLKKAEKGTLAREAAMDGYFRSLGSGPEVVAYASDTCDRLLTEKVRGEDCLAERYMSRPEKLCDLLAAILRDLHSVPTDGCPARHRTSEWLKTVADAEAEPRYFRENREFDAVLFPGSGGRGSAEALKATVSDCSPYMKEDTLIHGDFCLPNVILDGWKLSGFVDLGSGGAADRHIDIYWGAQTLWHNFRRADLSRRFLDAYGKDAIVPEILKAVSAGEAFG